MGVGIGGSADYAMYLAKEAIARPVGTRNPDPHVAKLEEELFALLKAQLEQARVRRVFDIATVEVLDHAHPPESRSSPNRKLVVLGMLVLGFLTALGGALLAESRVRGSGGGAS